MSNQRSPTQRSKIIKLGNAFRYNGRNDLDIRAAKRGLTFMAKELHLGA